MNVSESLSLFAKYGVPRHVWNNNTISFKNYIAGKRDIANLEDLKLTRIITNTVTVDLPITNLTAYTIESLRHYVYHRTRRCAKGVRNVLWVRGAFVLDMKEFKYTIMDKETVEKIRETWKR